MANQKKYWPGASGRKYEFEIFELDVKFSKDVVGNYIFTKRTPFGWDALYIGEGILQDRIHDDVHRPCAIEKGATHIHAHLNKCEQNRKDEEEDLLALHTEAYTPTGCNIKKGG